MTGPNVTGSPTGRLDRLGPAGRRLRALTEPVRSAVERAGRSARVTLREPAALRAAARAELRSRADLLARRLSADPDPTELAAAGDAALSSWLADPTPESGGLLTAVQGRLQAPAAPPAPRLADLPADEAARLAVLLLRLSPPPSPGGPA